MTKRKRTMLAAGLGLLSVGVAGFALSPAGHDVRNLWKTGAIQAAISEPEQRAYQGDNEANLKALRTALDLYHDSEGQYPTAGGWMDAIKDRLRASDMKPGEEMKKLHDPAVSDPTAYGYAMNDAVAGKFKGDVKDLKTVLVFESSATGFNAHGDPTKDARKGGKAIALDGSIVTLP